MSDVDFDINFFYQRLFITVESQDKQTMDAAETKYLHGRSWKLYPSVAYCIFPDLTDNPCKLHTFSHTTYNGSVPQIRITPGNILEPFGRTRMAILSWLFTLYNLNRQPWRIGKWIGWVRVLHSVQRLLSCSTQHCTHSFLWCSPHRHQSCHQRHFTYVAAYLEFF